MGRYTYEQFDKAREDFRENKLTKEDIKLLVKQGKLTPAEYKIIVREVYSMYKDVRRDLLID
jgi:5-methylcytosine-specific restriction endonuclease McrBC regulatory subunit McrC